MAKKKPEDILPALAAALSPYQGLIQRSRVLVATWLGRPGWTISLYLDKQFSGLRIDIFRLDGGRKTSVILYKSYGRHAAFNMYKGAKVFNKQTENVVANFLQWHSQQLANKDM